MNLIKLFMTIFFLSLFVKLSSNKNIVLKKENIRTEIDSLFVTYWDNIKANEYYYRYSNESLNIKSQYFGFEKEISEKITITKFIIYINQFYIDKTEKIILEKTKRNYVVSSEYPSITVIGYKGGKELFREHTHKLGMRNMM